MDIEFQLTAVVMLSAPAAVLLLAMLLITTLLIAFAVTALDGPVTHARPGTLTELRNAAHMVNTTADTPGDTEGHQQ